MVTILNTSMNQCFYVFRKARSPIAASGIEETTSNTGIRPHALANIVNISANTFTKVSYIIHETDTCGKHSIGSIFCHFSRSNIHHQDRITVQGKRTVKSLHYFFCLCTFNTDYYPIGRHKIFNGSSFFQKFGIGCHVKFDVHTPPVKLLLNNPTNFLCRTYRNSTLCNQNNMFCYIAPYCTGHFQNILQIGTAIFIRRSTYRTENNFHFIQASS